MSEKKTMIKRVLNDPKKAELDEEWNNFVKRIGEVSGLVKDMASGDKEKEQRASKLADMYLEGKLIYDENVHLTVKSDRTVINQSAFKKMGNENSEHVDKDAWMESVSKDAEKRAADKKVRRERAETYKTIATKNFNRGDFTKALDYYNKAIDQIRDNATLYCDRALTNLKLGNFEKVFNDVHWAERLNENSYKARLYRAKAHKELQQTDKYEECRKDLEDKFPQHHELTGYFLEKKITVEKEEENDEDRDTDTILI